MLTDGKFDEWGRRKPRKVDPAGDAQPGAVDLGRLWLADDGEALFLRLEVGRETLLQNSPTSAAGNRLRLYLDTDARRSTGARVGGLGVDLELRFGEREIIRYDADGVASLERPGSGIYQSMPTYSSEDFEIRVLLPELDAQADSSSSKRRKVKLLLREEGGSGDRLPDRGVVVYRLGKKGVAAPLPIGLEHPGDRAIRIVSLNVEDSLIGVVPRVYTRFFRALQPDVICLQSLPDWSAQRTLAFVEDALPDERWSIDRVGDIHTVSSFPILAGEPVDGNLVTLIGLPARLGDLDLVLFNAHPPCCGNDQGRDREVDNLMAVWRDLLDGAGPFAIDLDDAMVLLGDLNLVGFRRQFVALRDGVFVDPANGPDFDPGRSEGSLREAPLRHTHRRLIHTWRRVTSQFAPGKLDFVLYTGDALRHVGSFVLDTESMPAAVLEKAGLRATDSLDMSDHLALVVDFEPR